MPTPLHDDDLDDDFAEDDTPEDETPKGLRRAARDGKAARAEATRLARENAMLKAGIDTDTPLGALFSDGYKGDLTKDAVKAAWSALGAPAPASSSADAVDDEPAGDDVTFEPGEEQSTRERQALANGANTDAPAKPNPHENALLVAEKVTAGGGSRDDSMAGAFESLVNAGAQGDKRVIWNPGE